MAKKKNSWAGIIIGPLMVVFAIVALWKNETRFDFYKAARKTEVVNSVADAQNDQRISYTGPMDQGLEIKGQYVNSFSGYLRVDRKAEIFAWDEDTKDDGPSDWDLEWMSSVESNSRNGDVKQTLASEQFLPRQFDVGGMPVTSELIEFVDWSQDIPIDDLVLSKTGSDKGLNFSGEYLYVSKGRSDKLGDERVSFSGIPVPQTATYFGKFKDGQAVAYDDERRTGLLDKMIMNTGILHHIVAGDRATALQTMKDYIGRLKWIIRGIGTFAICLGFMIFFSTILGFLFAIPLIGPLAERGVLLVSVLLGVPLAGATIGISYLFAHPIWLALLFILIGVTIFMLRGRGKAVQANLKSQLDKEHGHVLDESEMKELEFMELVQLGQQDGKIDDDEQAFLHKWATDQGWSDEKFQQMLSKATGELGSPSESDPDTHLQNLIKLSLADGQLSNSEIKAIRGAARKAGFDEQTTRELIDKVRQSATIEVELVE